MHGKNEQKLRIINYIYNVISSIIYKIHSYYDMNKLNELHKLTTISLMWKTMKNRKGNYGQTILMDDAYLI
jgi:hypothetical protein